MQPNLTFFFCSIWYYITFFLISHNPVNSVPLSSSERLMSILHFGIYAKWVYSNEFALLCFSKFVCFYNFRRRTNYFATYQPSTDVINFFSPSTSKHTRIHTYIHTTIYIVQIVITFSYECLNIHALMKININFNAHVVVCICVCIYFACNCLY